MLSYKQLVLLVSSLGYEIFETNYKHITIYIARDLKQQYYARENKVEINKEYLTPAFDNVTDLFEYVLDLETRNMMT